MGLRGSEDLLKQLLWAARALGRVLAVPHLNAREAHNSVCRSNCTEKGCIAIMTMAIKIPCRRFSRVAGTRIAPMDPCELDAEADGRVECQLTVRRATLKASLA